jgi:RNA polymerase sigma factor (sigma-70 family)
MNATDHELLRQYARDASEAAFAELVRRHLDLVYSAARRQVRSVALAEEVAQSVFVDLSRNAARIKTGTPLVAWLHVVTRRTAIDVIRHESRREAREKIALEIAAMKTTSSAWEQVEPLLDEALESLNEADRHAILLRYFENKSLREVGAAIGASEDAAQKRVSRTLDQLRTLLARRGLTVTAAGLVTDLSAHAIVMAPGPLGAAITTAVLSTATLQTATVSASAITMTLLEKTILGTGLVFTLGAALFEANALRGQRIELAALRQETESLTAKIRDAQTQRDLALRRAADARERLAPSPAALTPADVTLQAAMTAWLDRVARFRRMAADHPELMIPEIQLLTDDAWFEVTRRVTPPHVEGNVRVEMSFLRSTAESKFAPKLRAALHAYLAANDGMLPADSGQLAPFFDPPIAPATLGRYKMTAQGRLSELSATQRNALIEQRSPVDWEEDLVWRIGASSESPTYALGVAAKEAIKAFKAANNDMPPTNAPQLLPYLPGPIDPARLTQFLNPSR